MSIIIPTGPWDDLNIREERKGIKLTIMPSFAPLETR